MVLWIAMAVLAAAACVPLLVVLGRAATAAPSASAQAMAIYRDQLDEVGRDLTRGVIADSEAAAARTEIARRLIREGEASPAALPPASRSRAAATVAVIAMPVAALGLYLLLGSPQDPDQPLSSRPNAVASQEVTKLVAAVEAHLAATPDDGKGWEVIAPIYSRLGRDADAVHAWSKAVALLGATAAREANFGEAMVRANGGTVTPEAMAAFERARGLAPDDARPRFYLALALGQSGKVDEAKAAWQALIHDAPTDATWLPAATAQLAALEAPAAGPAANDVAAAANLSPEQRQQMIGGMVASLAERLKTEPGDADGWARLIRSYIVLGRTEEARAALAAARAALTNDAAKLASIEGTALELGLTGATE